MATAGSAPLVGGVAKTGSGLAVPGGGVGGVIGGAVNLAGGLASAAAPIIGAALSPGYPQAAPQAVAQPTYIPAQASYSAPAPAPTQVYIPYEIPSAPAAPAIANAYATANVTVPDAPTPPPSVPQISAPPMIQAPPMQAVPALQMPPMSQMYPPMGFDSEGLAPLTPTAPPQIQIPPNSTFKSGTSESSSPSPLPTRVTRQVQEMPMFPDQEAPPTRVLRRVPSGQQQPPGYGNITPADFMGGWDNQQQSNGAPVQSANHNPIAGMPSNSPAVQLAQQYHNYMQGQPQPQPDPSMGQNNGYYGGQPGGPPNPAAYFPQLYGQRPQVGPQSGWGRAAVAFARGMSPRFDKQYGQYQAGLAEQQKTQFEQSNQNWRQQSVNDTNLQIEQMKQQAQGKLTLAQMLDQVGKIRELEPGSPQRMNALAELATVAQPLGYSYQDFAHLLNEPWSAKQIAETKKAASDAYTSGLDALKKTQNLPGEIAGENAVNSGKVRQESEAQANAPYRQASVAATALTQAADYAFKTQTWSDRVMQEQIETLAKQSGLVKTNEDIAKLRMDMAQDPLNTMLALAKGAAYVQSVAPMDPSGNLQQAANGLGSMAGQIAGQQPLQGYLNAVNSRGQYGMVPPPPPNAVPAGMMGQYPQFMQQPAPQQAMPAQPQAQPQPQAPTAPPQMPVQANNVAPAQGSGSWGDFMWRQQTGQHDPEFTALMKPFNDRQAAQAKQSAETDFTSLVNSIPNRDLMTPQSRGLKRGAKLTDPDIASNFALKAGTAENFNKLVKAYGWSEFDRSGVPQPLTAQFKPKPTPLPGSPGYGPKPGQKTSEIVDGFTQFFRGQQPQPLASR